MFDLDDFVAACTSAMDDASPREAVRELLARAVSDPLAVADALPPTRAELVPLYQSATLTMMKVVWAPGMAIPPHDHRMWALIGIYGGSEDNAFYRRAGGSIVPAGGRRLGTSDVAVLGTKAIHAVANPLAHEYAGAIHVYGGDFMAEERSMWDAESMVEGPANGETVQALFEAANEALAAAPDTAD